VDDGFQIEPSVLTCEECDDILAALATLRNRAGTRHLMSHSAVAALAADDRLSGIA
jgi:hypothetical protein